MDRVVNPIEEEYKAMLASPYAAMWRATGSWEWLTKNGMWGAR